ncbi:MAG: hypothetical protein LC799_18780 [Actinobacteria bacterium]|nr:hypothetical protein [Actinomycetota bacterium]
MARTAVACRQRHYWIITKLVIAIAIIGSAFGFLHRWAVTAAERSAQLAAAGGGAGVGEVGVRLVAGFGTAVFFVAVATVLSVSKPYSAREHLSEATETAGRTGNGTFAGLNFGPINVGIWRVALALELGEPGRVIELTRDVDVSAIPSAGRQATFYGDVGRGLASIRGRERQAVEALRRAETLAPQRTRTNPFIRETVTELMRRARRDSVGRELRGMAYRMGIGVG